MVKKLITGAQVLALAFAFSVPAFAANSNAIHATQCSCSCCDHCPGCHGCSEGNCDCCSGGCAQPDSK